MKKEKVKPWHMWLLDCVVVAVLVTAFVSSAVGFGLGSARERNFCEEEKATIESLNKNKLGE